MSAPNIGLRSAWPGGPTAAIDWSHPLAQGLQMFAVPSTRRDMVTSGPLTLNGTPDLGASQYGPGATTFSSTSFLTATGSPLGASSVCSVFAGGRLPSSFGAAGRPIFCERASSGANIFKIKWGEASANRIRLTYRDDASTLINADGVTTITASSQFFVGVVRRSATSFDSWINGNRDTTFTSGTMTANFTNASMQRRIGSDAQNAANENFGDGVISFVAGWTRALSENEIAALYADPFQMFRR
jgi:hypothetical protein